MEDEAEFESAAAAPVAGEALVVGHIWNVGFIQCLDLAPTKNRFATLACRDVGHWQSVELQVGWLLSPGQSWAAPAIAEARQGA